MKFIILATIALIAGYFGFFSRESKPPALQRRRHEC
jgi:hypothetical protein